MISSIQPLGPVSFPANTGERAYMIPFYQRDGLPSSLARWQPTVNQLLVGIETDQSIYLMIDQSFVKAGRAQRRQGVHIDGYWCAGAGRHEKHRPVSPGAHRTEMPTPPRHHPAPTPGAPTPGHRAVGWKQYPWKPAPTPTTPKDESWWLPADWSNASFSDPEAIILASDVAACHAYVGEWRGAPNAGGDCSHVDLSGLERLTMTPNRGYMGNVTMLHESVPVTQDCYRSLVRLNLPGVRLAA